MYLGAACCGPLLSLLVVEQVLALAPAVKLHHYQSVSDTCSLAEEQMKLSSCLFGII
jgi:hypothetical protein